VLVVPGSARTGLLVTGKQYRWVPVCSNWANWQENDAGRSKPGASSSRFGKNSAASDLLGTRVEANPVLVVPGSARTVLLVTGKQ
jgi:hypothetical protein